LLFAFVAMLPAHLIAQNYSYTNIDYPGANMTSPTAVNDSGSVVGTYLDSNGNTHGFLYSGGVYTTIDDPEGTTFPQGINNSGEITGAVAVSLSEDYGFTYVDGVFTTFSYPGGNGQTGGQGINNHNEIVGIYTTGGTVGFLDNNGSFSTFNYPGADDTFPHAISDSGAIAGFYTASTVPFGFVYDGSTFTSINYSGTIIPPTRSASSGKRVNSRSSTRRRSRNLPASTTTGKSWACIFPAATITALSPLQLPRRRHCSFTPPCLAV